MRFEFARVSRTESLEGAEVLVRTLGGKAYGALRGLRRRRIDRWRWSEVPLPGVLETRRATETVYRAAL